MSQKHLAEKDKKLLVKHFGYGRAKDMFLNELRRITNEQCSKEVIDIAKNGSRENREAAVEWAVYLKALIVWINECDFNIKK